MMRLGALSTTGECMSKRTPQEKRRLSELSRALREAGISVWEMYPPSDLLLRFWCNRHHDFCWMPVSHFNRKKDVAFLEETSTPIVKDFESAWREINKRHDLGRIDVPCVMHPMRK